MRTPRVAAVATLLALSLLTACGDGDDDSDAEEEVTATVTQSPSETTSAPTEPTETSVTPMDPTEGDITVEQVDAALLTPEDVAPGLVLGTWSSEDSPPPCDPTGTPVDTAFPPSVESGVQINTADGNASMEEELAIYETEDVAAEAFAAGTASLACGTATLPDGSTASIGPATDVTADVNAGRVGSSTAWQISGDGFEVVLVATLAGRIIMACTFSSTPDADTSSLPTPIEIAEAAFTKALAN